ncbi:MAG: outer membrane beta-barrel protein [Bacteroidaceae bacterium]|nr:outer membrane beta-barrel protein [Bacteroidaceae bacterium]
MNKVKVLLTTMLIMVCSVVTPSICVGQFHAGVDFRYSWGLSETLVDNDLNLQANPANSLSIALNCLYEFTPQIWAGIGVNTNINNHGLTILENNSTTQMPIMQLAPYLTMRYRPISSHLNAYLFTDLGYAIPFKTSEGIQTFSNGVMWNIGVGYSYMFKKHFGLNFNVGYYLQQIQGTPTLIIEHPIGRTDVGIIAQNNLRHSIGVTLGLIF